MNPELETLFRLRYYPVRTDSEYIRQLPAAVVNELYLLRGGRWRPGSFEYKVDMITLAVGFNNEYQKELEVDIEYTLRQYYREQHSVLGATGA